MAIFYDNYSPYRMRPMGTSAIPSPQTPTMSPTGPYNSGRVYATAATPAQQMTNQTTQGAINRGTTQRGINSISPPPPPTYAQGPGLEAFGYRGDIGFNPMENAAFGYMQQLFQNPSWANAMGQAQNFWLGAMNGAYGPQSQAYQQAVLDPTYAMAQKAYTEASKNLANNFAQYGNYFSGKQGVAQGRLASDFANQMAQTAANANLQAWNQDLAMRQMAGQMLPQTAMNQNSMEMNMLNQMLNTGNYMTQRQMYNNATYADFVNRAYQDWLRARNEMMLPYQAMIGGLNTRAFEPLVQQDNSWAQAFSSIGMMLPYILQSFK